MATLAQRAHRHRRAQQRLALMAARAVRRAVAAAMRQQQVSSDSTVPVLAAAGVLATYQAAAALAAGRVVAGELGSAPASVASAFAGTTQLGWLTQAPLTSILSAGSRATGAEAMGRQLASGAAVALDAFIRSEVIAAGSDAASVEIAFGDAQFVRVLRLPSCGRCVALAGRTYTSSEAFPRHPLCDCEHWPVGSEEEAKRGGLVIDPLEAVKRGQVRGLSKADLRAIEDGASVTSVVNARRGGGSRPPGMTNAVNAEVFGRVVKATTESATARGSWRQRNPKLPVRLRPESIYEHARDREHALRLLRMYGYIR